MSAGSKPLFDLADLQAGIVNETIRLQISPKRIQILRQLTGGNIRDFIERVSSKLTDQHFSKVWTHRGVGYADVYGIRAGCFYLPRSEDICWYLKMGFSPVEGRDAPDLSDPRLIMSFHPTREITTRLGYLTTTRNIPEECYCNDKPKRPKR